MLQRAWSGENTNATVYLRNGLDASASIRIKKRIFSFLVLLPVIMLFIVCVTVHFDLKKTFARDQACVMFCLRCK